MRAASNCNQQEGLPSFGRERRQGARSRISDQTRLRAGFAVAPRQRL
jgi:hypothetical protein